MFGSRIRNAGTRPVCLSWLLKWSAHFMLWLKCNSPLTWMVATCNTMQNASKIRTQWSMSSWNCHVGWHVSRLFQCWYWCKLMQFELALLCTKPQLHMDTQTVTHTHTHTHTRTHTRTHFAGPDLIIYPPSASNAMHTACVPGGNGCCRLIILCNEVSMKHHFPVPHLVIVSATCLVTVETMGQSPSACLKPHQL